MNQRGRRDSAAPLCRMPRRRTAGLTLIELLVTMVISLIILGAVSYTYLGSKGAYRTNDSLARVQETGRFAMDAIVRDLHRTGFVGCASSATATGAPPSITDVGGQIAFADVVQAYAGGTGFTPPTGLTLAPNADVLTLRLATSAPVSMAAPPDTTLGVISVNPAACAWLQPNQEVMISSCTRATRAFVNTVPGCPAPAAGPATFSYKPDPISGSRDLGPAGATGLTLDSFVTIQQFDEVTYFVASNPAGGTSLYRFSASAGGAEEVVDNVETMFVQFGVSAPGAPGAVSGPLVPASAMTAATWPLVVSVQVQLLAVGGDKATDIGAAATLPTVAFGPPGAAPLVAPDTRLRDVFTTTVALRNRVS